MLQQLEARPLIEEEGSYFGYFFKEVYTFKGEGRTELLSEHLFLFSFVLLRQLFDMAL